MKKQLSIFAAAAMVATLASVAAAATTPTITMGGTMDYRVEYNAHDHVFGGDDGIAEGGLTGDQCLDFKVSATGAGGSKMDVTFNVDSLDDGGWSTGTTIEGKVGSTTIRLGQVNGNYQQDLAVNAGGAGGGITQAFGPVTIDAFSATTGIADSLGYKDIAGGKVNIASGSNSAYAAAILTPAGDGAFQVGGNFAQGTLLTLNGTYTSTLTDAPGVDTLAYLSAKATSTPMPGLNVYGELYNVDLGFKTLWGKTDGDNIGVGEWAGRDAKYDGTNIKVGAGYDVLKINDAVALNVGGEFFTYADESNYIKGSVKYTPVFLDNAFVQMNNGAGISADNNEVGATFIYTVSGVKITATGKYKATAEFKGAQEFGDTYGELRADYTFAEWLNTWARLRKDYKAAAGDAAKPVVPSIGLNAKVTF